VTASSGRDTDDINDVTDEEKVNDPKSKEFQGYRFSDEFETHGRAILVHYQQLIHRRRYIIASTDDSSGSCNGMIEEKELDSKTIGCYYYIIGRLKLDGLFTTRDAKAAMITWHNGTCANPNTSTSSSMSGGSEHNMDQKPDQEEQQEGKGSGGSEDTDGSCEHAIAWSYDNGIGVDARDDIKAFQWFTSAARFGLSRSLHSLAIIHERYKRSELAFTFMMQAANGIDTHIHQTSPHPSHFLSIVILIIDIGHTNVW
jgi:hypothetical protein